MLKYPYGETFQSQQPLILLDGSVYAMTGASSTAAVLETVAGVRHSLEVIGRLDSMWKNSLRSSLPTIEALVLEQLPRRVAELQTDPLTYFSDFLVPAFQQREFSEDIYVTESTVPKPKHIDWALEVVRTARTIPAPEVNQPSLWLFGRVWSLRRGGGPNRCWRVLANNELYSLSGEFSFVSSLTANWRSQVTKYMTYVAAGLAADVGDLEHTVQARSELDQNGSVERGDLIYIAGKPPLLGHIIPSHYNRVLSRTVTRDLAVAAPFTLPPTASRSSLAIYERRGSVWQSYHPPHGLCFGPDPPSYEQEAPGIGLAALLRWAAQRIAGNGIFHSSDESETTNYDEYTY